MRLISKAKLTAVVLVLAMFAFPIFGISEEAAQPVPAEKDVQIYRWHHKLGRGAMNIVSAPAETMKWIDQVSLEEGHLKGFTVGFWKGLKFGFTRLGVGFVDFFTFPFNYPNQKKAPLMEPEYYWQVPDVADLPRQRD